MGLVYLKRTGTWPQFRYWYWHPGEVCLVTSRGQNKPEGRDIANRPAYAKHPRDRARYRHQVGDVVWHEPSARLCDITWLGDRPFAEIHIRSGGYDTELPRRELAFVSANVAGGPGMQPADPNIAGAIWAVEQAHLESVGQLWLDQYIRDQYPTLRIGPRTMQDLHARLLGHIFPWAGRFRAHEVWVGRRDSPTPPPEVVRDQVKAFFRAFANPLLRQAREERRSLLAALSELHCELARIHPFPDGNGRVIRKLCEVIALQRGHKLDWRLQRSGERKRYHYAVKKAVHDERRYFLDRLLDRALTRL